jgi:hypothetical protein
MVMVTIKKVIQWDAVAMVDRLYWRIELDGSKRRKITRTLREAKEWCTEQGLEFEVDRTTQHLI